MKLRHVFAANAVLNLPYALGFIFAPAAVLAVYGIEQNAAGLMMARLFGASILGVAGVAWAMRPAAETGLGWAVALALAIGDTIGAVIFLQAQLTSVVNAMGWGVVAIYVFFAGAYSYEVLAHLKQRSVHLGAIPH